ncbi:hypothetical protein U9M48_034524 [Paspalum notatum var. saurae]|uniref:Uncharacterized protein n=1 Tax=Paspalum notatum var. saurae TaxID=547442 RepID=A0AAQ3X739_PASNO
MSQQSSSATTTDTDVEAARCICSSCCSPTWSGPIEVRYVYTGLFVVAGLLAWVARESRVSSYTQQRAGVCRGDSDCIAAEAVLRFSLFSFFLRWHHSTVSSSTGELHMVEQRMSYMMCLILISAVRYVSRLNDEWCMTNFEEHQRQVTILSVGLYTASIVGIVAQMFFYGGTGWLNRLLICTTLLLVHIMPLIALITSKVTVRERLEDDVPYGYGFFHFVFATGSMYLGMVFVSWDTHNATVQTFSMDVGWTCTVIHIVNEGAVVVYYVGKHLARMMCGAGGQQQGDTAAETVDVQQGSRPAATAQTQTAVDVHIPDITPSILDRVWRSAAAAAETEAATAAAGAAPSRRPPRGGQLQPAAGIETCSTSSSSAAAAAAAADAAHRILSTSTIAVPTGRRR